MNRVVVNGVDCSPDVWEARLAAAGDRAARLEGALRKVSQMAGAPDPLAALRAVVVIARTALAPPPEAEKEVPRG